VYEPSNFTTSNDTNVTFIFPSYELHHYCLSAILMRVLCRGVIPHSATKGPFDNSSSYDTDGTGSDSGLQSGKQFRVTIRITKDLKRKQTFYHVFLFWCNSTFAAYLASVKALGSNASNVVRSLVPQGSVYLLYLERLSGFLHCQWPSNGGCGRSDDYCAFVIQFVLVLIHKPPVANSFFLYSFGAAFGSSKA